MMAHLARYGGKRFQIGKEVADVFDPRVRVRRIGKGRKIMKSGRRNSFGHRANEFGLGPSADAIGRIRRDIRSVEGPERRRDGEAATEPQPIGLARHRMAGGTTSGVECREAIGEVWGVSGEQIRRDNRRNC